jgi:hypothetical protein
LWDSVSKVIIYVEFYERKGIPYAVEWRLSFIFTEHFIPRNRLADVSQHDKL